MDKKMREGVVFGSFDETKEQPLAFSLDCH